MSHPPRKPLFWHALFVHKTAGMLCLKVFVCLWLTASGCEMRRAGNQTHESAHHIPHSLDTRDAPGSSPRENLCVCTLFLCLFVCLRFTASCCGVCGTFHNNVKAHIRTQLHSTFNSHESTTKSVPAPFLLSGRTCSTVAVENG